MKSIVDSQELQIQRNMIEEEDMPEGHSQQGYHPHEEHRITFLMKDEPTKTQDSWWSENDESENKDFLQFLN